MKKTLLILLILFTISVVYLLSEPRTRHILFTGVIKFPEFAISQSMRSALIGRDINKAILWLNKHHRIAVWYGGANNRIVPGFIENIKTAFETAVLPHEREKFFDVLIKAGKLSPDNIDLKLMLAQVMMYKNKKETLKYLSQAKKIVPSDIRIYQIASVVLRNEKNTKMLDSWCQSYNSAQFGDYEGYNSSTLLGGGYRRITFEYDADSKHKLIMNEGVQLGKLITYEFIPENAVILKNPSLRLSTGGGIEVKIHGGRLYSEGSLVEKFTRSAISLYPETGYIYNGNIITNNRMGENIYIQYEGFTKHALDKVEFDITVNKLPINDVLSCKK